MSATATTTAAPATAPIPLGALTAQGQSTNITTVRGTNAAGTTSATPQQPPVTTAPGQPLVQQGQQGQQGHNGQTAQQVAQSQQGQKAVPAAPQKQSSNGISAATWIAVGLAAGALIVAVYYGEPMLRLAKWTAENDFFQSCVNARSMGLPAPAGCNTTLLELRPPPVKRSLPTLTRRTFMGFEYGDPWQPVTNIGVIVLTLVVAIIIFRKELERRPRPTTSAVRTDWCCYGHDTKSPRRLIGCAAVIEQGHLHSHTSYGSPAYHVFEASFSQRVAKLRKSLKIADHANGETLDAFPPSAIGRVKWYNESKGLGFITPAEGGESVFVHFSAIMSRGPKTLTAGETVYFDVRNGLKGRHAMNVWSNHASMRQGEIAASWEEVELLNDGLHTGTWSRPYAAAETSNSDNGGESDSKERNITFLSDTLRLARAVVARDESKDLGVALKAYQTAINLLLQAFDAAGLGETSCKQEIEELLLKYESRANELEAMVQIQSDPSSLLGSLEDPGREASLFQDGRERPNLQFAVAKGRVKWFDRSKGFGIISQEGRGEDLLVYADAIQDVPNAWLNDGRFVWYSVAEGESSSAIRRLWTTPAGVLAALRSPRLTSRSDEPTPDTGNDTAETHTADTLKDPATVDTKDSPSPGSEVLDIVQPEASSQHSEPEHNGKAVKHDLQDDVLDDSSSRLSTPGLEEEDIDFEMCYALHNFIATVEGQAEVAKGDTLLLLDDSNSYWWLVRVVKDGSIGYLPAEHVETPTERLARLNKHRNIKLAVLMLGDIKSSGRDRWRSAMGQREKSEKRPHFHSAPTIIGHSDGDQHLDHNNPNLQATFDPNGTAQVHQSQAQVAASKARKPMRHHRVTTRLLLWSRMAVSA